MLLNIKSPTGKADGWDWEKIMNMAGEGYLEWAVSRVSALTNTTNGMEKETLSKLDIIRSSSTEQSDIYGITLCFYYLFEILRVTGCNCCPQALIMWLSKGGSIQIDVLPFILSTEIEVRDRLSHYPSWWKALQAHGKPFVDSNLWSATP